MLSKPPPVNIYRPGTLQEVVLSEIKLGSDKRRSLLSGFLDEFYGDTDPAGRRHRLEDEPPLTGDNKTDALVGAIGEHLCHRWALGTPPRWTKQQKTISSSAIISRFGEV